MKSGKQSYTQMTLAVREEISRGMAAGLKQGMIAQLVGFSTDRKFNRMKASMAQVLDIYRPLTRAT